VTLSPAVGTTVPIGDAIADLNGSIAASGGAGSLVLNAGGTVKLLAASSFTGGTTLSAQATLELSNPAAAGTGDIVFTGPGMLRVNGTTMPTNQLTGFIPTSTLDLPSLTFVLGATAVISSGTLTVTSNGTVETLKVSGLPDGTVAISTDSTGGTKVTGTPTSYLVHNETELNDALAKMDIGGIYSAVNTPYTITLAPGLPNGSLTLSQNALAVNLMSGSSLTIIGNGETLDGGGVARGLFVQTGSVTLNNITIANGLAKGGNGGNAFASGAGVGGGGAGGGAGLGGGLFVGASGTVTLIHTNFANNAAIGGAGGGGVFGSGAQGGGGGGLGGNGGTASVTGPGGGGGVGGPGGVGAGGTGGAAGTAGIIQGVAAANNASGGGFGGAQAGGGGGGVSPGAGANGGIAGGFGGGGGGASAAGTGLAGGFGGGGGGGGVKGGIGGFGGGGGNGNALGGLGGGNGGGVTGGGGMAAGGDIFIQTGGQIIFQSGTLLAGTTTQGAAGVIPGTSNTNGAQPGKAFGSGVYLNGAQQFNLFPTPGDTIVVGGAIDSDFTAFGGIQPKSTINVGGGGLVQLTGSSKLSGGIRLQDNGTLELTQQTSAGTSLIDFLGAGTLRIDSVAMPANQIDLLGPTDTVDITQLPFVAGATATVKNALLTVESGGITKTLFLTGLLNGDAQVADDGHGGTNVIGLQTNITVSNADDLAKAISQMSIGGLDQAKNQVYHITFATGLAGGAIALSTELPAINVDTGSTIVLDGAGQILDAVSVGRVLTLVGGSLQIKNLTVTDGVAVGGNGGYGTKFGGGGGAGLGGGLFVAAGATATLTNSFFQLNTAVGGSGGSVFGAYAVSNGNAGGGGGGMGGGGGTGVARRSGGGGGFGAQAAGGTYGIAVSGIFPNVVGGGGGGAAGGQTVSSYTIGYGGGVSPSGIAGEFGGGGGGGAQTT
ncbi:MAG: hypothetical protein NT133_21165, partial [Alphaproteobacteria bacterium]|nr:hypothetical protein [Alphaproteobacteria bacterium]